MFLAPHLQEQNSEFQPLLRLHLAGDTEAPTSWAIAVSTHSEYVSMKRL